MMRRAAAITLCVCTIFSAMGCMLQSVDPKAPLATDVDAKKALSEYWFNQPAVEHIEWNDYDALWHACEQAAIESSFVVERVDFRTGLLTTKPLVSKQFFEAWKGDVVNPHD